MTVESEIRIQGYAVALDRGYHPRTDVWVLPVGPGRVRVGLDPLGVETLGSLAQVALAEVGTTVAAGDPLGSMEAEKFVGPLAAPVSGRIVAVNDDVVADPRSVHADPNGAWFVELEVTGDPLAGLVVGDDIAPWFAAKVADYRAQGVLAE